MTGPPFGRPVVQKVRQSYHGSETTTCHLCLEEQPLKNSHVLPEFLYRLIYDEKHRFELVTTGSDGAIEVQQKGLREPLFCGACEQKLGRWERYASQIFVHRPATSWDQTTRRVRIADVSYAELKLFVLSLIWRAGVSSLAAFKQVRLGPHEEWLRRMLVDENPGSTHEYPYGFIALPHHGDLLGHTIVPPYAFKVKGIRGYRLLFASTMCTVVVSRNIRPEQVGKWSHRPGEDLFISVSSIEQERRYLHNIARTLPDTFFGEET